MAHNVVQDNYGLLDDSHTPEYEEESALAHIALMLADADPDIVRSDKLDKLLAAEDRDITVLQLVRTVYAFGLRLRVSFEKIPTSENT